MKVKNAEKEKVTWQKKAFKGRGKESISQFNESDHPSSENNNPVSNGFSMIVKILTLNDKIN